MSDLTTFSTLSPSDQDIQDEALANGAFDGDLQAVRDALAKGANPKTNDSEALYWASYRGHLEIVQLLAHQSDNLVVAMEHACRAKHEQVVMFLAPFCLNEHTPPDTLGNVFLEMAGMGSVSVLEFFGDADHIEQGHKNVALIQACDMGFLEVAQWLLERKADPRINNGSAMVRAAVEGHAPIIELLIPHFTDTQMLQVSDKLDTIGAMDGRKAQFRHLWQRHQLTQELAQEGAVGVEPKPRKM